MSPANTLYRSSAQFIKQALVVMGFVAAAYLPIGLQTGSLHLPELIRLAGNPSLQAIPTKSSLSAAPPQHGDQPWTINFANQPNGILSRHDWNFAAGVTEANYNQELEAYTARASNARVENGMLVIDAHPEQLDGKAYTSARIDTRGKFDFTYGTLEVTMKLPKGVGTWPAAWLLPATNKYNPASYGVAASDPYAWSVNGEIDFMEAIGNLPGQIIPATHSYDGMHEAPIYTPAHVPDSATAFHTYGVIKTPTKITFTIDGKPYASRTKNGDSPLAWPYDQPYYLILNLAIGGKWTGDKGINPTTAPWQLQVKSINYTPLQ